MGIGVAVCPFCGRSINDQASFCEFCGGQLDAGYDLVEEIPTQEKAEEKIRAALADRQRTDRRIPPIWAVIAFLPILIVSLSYSLLQLLLYLLGFDFHDLRILYLIVRPLAFLFLAAALSYLTYLMLWRLNKHIEREEKLRAALMSYIRHRSSEAGEDKQMIPGLLRLSSYDGQARVYEKKLSEGKWSIIVFAILWLEAVPSLYQGATALLDDTHHYSFGFYIWSSLIASFAMIILLIILAFLASHMMRTIYTHDLRWTAFINSLRPSMRLVGKEMALPQISSPLKERSVVLYAILTLITFGLFAIYWLYVLLRDPNTHFAGHELTEFAIEAAIKS
jgi:hypothetical protein